jgi:predicted lipoprotein with Yx(FWY)xxD motif
MPLDTAVRRSIRSLPVAAALTAGLSLAVLTGCSAVGEYPATGDAVAVASPDDSAATPGSAPSPAAPAVLTVAEADGVGQVAVDSEGFTLYRFDDDTAQPPTSNCSGGCAQAWPPATIEAGADVVAEGIDAGLIGTMTRDDGTVQLTLGGWPLYRYAEDAAPGDALGHEVAGTWFAATATGERASRTASEAPGEPDEPAESAADDTDEPGYDY